MKKFLVITNLALIAALAIAIAIPLLSRDEVLVRVIDESGCSLEYYEIGLAEKSVVVSASQRGSGYTLAPVLGDYDTLIPFIAKIDEDGLIRYTLTANYRDCDQIVSEQRMAKKGQLIYEFVKNNEMSFLIRSG